MKRIARVESLTNAYLDEVIEERQLPSDYALAIELGISPQAISKMRAGGTMGVKTAVKVAEILGNPPLEVIAATQQEADPTPIDAERASIWKKYIKPAKAGLLSALIFTGAGIATPPPASAAPTSHNQISQYKLCPGRRRKKAGFFDGLTLAAADLAAAALGIPGQRIA